MGVLYIEDDAEMVNLVRLALGSGREFVGISNWEDILTYLQCVQDIPETIFLDYYLGGFTAEDVLTQLQGYPKFDHTRIILLSSSEVAMARLKRKYPARVCDCISKPFSIQHLRELANAVTV